MALRVAVLTGHQGPHKALEQTIEIELCSPTWLMGRSFFLLSSLSFFFLTLFFPLMDEIRRNDASVRRGLGTFLGFSVWCYLKKKTKLPHKTQLYSHKSPAPRLKSPFPCPGTGFPNEPQLIHADNGVPRELHVIGAVSKGLARPVGGGLSRLPAGSL